MMLFGVDTDVEHFHFQEKTQKKELRKHKLLFFSPSFPFFGVNNKRGEKVQHEIVKTGKTTEGIEYNKTFPSPESTGEKKRRRKRKNY